MYKYGKSSGNLTNIQISKQKQLSEQNYSIDTLLTNFSILESIYLKLQGKDSKKEKIFGRYDKADISHKSINQLLDQASVSLLAYASCKSVFQMTYKEYVLPDSFPPEKAKYYLQLFGQVFKQKGCYKALQLAQSLYNILFCDAASQYNRLLSGINSSDQKPQTNEGLIQTAKNLFGALIFGQNQSEKIGKEFEKENIQCAKDIQTKLNENRCDSYKDTNQYGGHNQNVNYQSSSTQGYKANQHGHEQPNLTSPKPTHSPCLTSVYEQQALPNFSEPTSYRHSDEAIKTKKGGTKNHQKL